MKAFVTGGTGLLGSNLIRLLVSQGHEVKALVRSREKAQKLLGDLKVEWVIGDMEDVEAFRHELAGSDVVFHTAAYFREYFGLGDHWPKLERINVKATIQLLEAGEKAGVKKAIYVSSSTVIGESPSGVSDESTPPDDFAEINLYAKSKVAGEKAVFDFIRQHTMPVVLILPSAMVGPQDAAPTAFGELIMNILQRQLPALPAGGMNVVDVRDVAQAMINAVEQGKSGERYLISNRYIELKQVGEVLTQISGVPSPRIAPYLPLLIYAWTQERIASITGGEPQATVSAVRTLRKRYTVSGKKAERTLGVKYRSFEESVRDEVQWYVDHGYLKLQPQTLKQLRASSLA
jgi:dihydroflavonol-4-reductase